jgi:hypothetical protein
MQPFVLGFPANRRRGIGPKDHCYCKKRGHKYLQWEVAKVHLEHMLSCSAEAGETKQHG